MRNKLRIVKDTVDSRVYKMASREGVVGCPICPPHRGCNRLRWGQIKNWKRFRKTQWR